MNNTTAPDTMVEDDDGYTMKISKKLQRCNKRKAKENEEKTITSDNKQVSHDDKTGVTIDTAKNTFHSSTESTGYSVRTIRFEFGKHGKNQALNNENHMIKTTYRIIEQMIINEPELELTTWNKMTKINSMEKLSTIPNNEVFSISYGVRNSNKNDEVFFHIVDKSNIAITKMKHISDVKRILQEYAVYVSYHRLHTTKTKKLGIIHGKIPEWCNIEEIEERINMDIDKFIDENNKKVITSEEIVLPPKSKHHIQLRYNNLSHKAKSSDGTIKSMSAPVFDVIANEGNSNHISNIMKNMNHNKKKTGTFVPGNVLATNEKTKMGIIVEQNKFAAHHVAIPVHGLDHDIMDGDLTLEGDKKNTMEWIEYEKDCDGNDLFVDVEMKTPNRGIWYFITKDTNEEDAMDYLNDFMGDINDAYVVEEGSISKESRNPEHYIRVTVNSSVPYWKKEQAESYAKGHSTKEVDSYNSDDFPYFNSAKKNIPKAITVDKLVPHQPSAWKNPIATLQDAKSNSNIQRSSQSHASTESKATSAMETMTIFTENMKRYEERDIERHERDIERQAQLLSFFEKQQERADYLEQKAEERAIEQASKAEEREREQAQKAEERANEQARLAEERTAEQARKTEQYHREMMTVMMNTLASIARNNQQLPSLLPATNTGQLNTNNNAMSTLQLALTNSIPPINFFGVPASAGNNVTNVPHFTTNTKTITSKVHNLDTTSLTQNVDMTVDVATPLKQKGNESDIEDISNMSPIYYGDTNESGLTLQDIDDEHTARRASETKKANRELYQSSAGDMSMALDLDPNDLTETFGKDL